MRKMLSFKNTSLLRFQPFQPDSLIAYRQKASKPVAANAIGYLQEIQSWEPEILRGAKKMLENNDFHNLEIHVNISKRNVKYSQKRQHF